LEQRLRNIIADTELQQRARRQLGYVALAAALMRHARDERDEPPPTSRRSSRASTRHAPPDQNPKPASPSLSRPERLRTLI
jgi:hypothetical protein